MTVLGVGVGIGVFVSLVSISKSYQVQVRDLIKAYHLDITIQSKGASSPFTSRIDGSYAKRLRGINGIRSVSSLIIGGKRTKWNPYFFIMGAYPEERIVSRIRLIEGRPFASGKNEVIIGELLARKLGLAPNDMLTISNEVSYKITGIYKVGSRIFDSSVILDIEKAQEILDRKNQINLIIAYTDGQKKIDPIVTTINNTFPKLTAQQGNQFIDRIRMFRTLDASFYAVSFISITSCCFIIVNTLLMAITERIKEIGILMAIGWNRVMIMMTIAIEALLICFLGFGMGGAVGTLFMWFLNHRNLVAFGCIPLYPAGDVMFLAFGLSILLGIFSAIYPGIIATRMLPAKALMHE